jgi:hypothetical protein
LKVINWQTVKAIETFVESTFNSIHNAWTWAAIAAIPNMLIKNLRNKYIKKNKQTNKQKQTSWMKGGGYV